MSSIGKSIGLIISKARIQPSVYKGTMGHPGKRGRAASSGRAAVFLVHMNPWGQSQQHTRKKPPRLLSSSK